MQTNSHVLTDILHNNEILFFKLKKSIKDYFLFDINKFNNCFFYVSQKNCTEIYDWLNKNGWEITSSLYQINNKKFDLIITSEFNKDTIYKISHKNTLLISYFLNDAIKKKAIIIIEEAGYRMIKELGKYALFFKSLNQCDITFNNEKLSHINPQFIANCTNRKISLLPPDTLAQVIKIDASQLLNSKRFDIAIKLLYARLWNNNIAKEWREDVYYEHLLRITGPGNKLVEYGTEKKGIAMFKKNYHSLLNEKDQDKIPIVPIDKYGIAYDGAHRIAAAIYSKKNISCIAVNDQSKSIATYDFFKSKKNGHKPISSEILDESAIEYCINKKTTAIALVFPSVSSVKIAHQELNKICNIVYSKNVDITPKAGRGLLRQIYHGQPWLDVTGKESGFKYKIKSCFPYTGALRIYLIDNYKIENLRSTKELIRKKYNIGNHSIHITDSIEETILAARILFNKNSLNILKRGINETVKFHDKLFQFRDWIYTNEINEHLVCIDSSSILELLNLRQAKDLDFLYHGDASLLPQLPHGIECHNNQAQYYNYCIADIVGDPRLHFWYMGVKLCIPEIVRDMKINRHETKDIIDVKMLNSKLSHKFTNAIYKHYHFFSGIINYLKALLYRLLQKCKQLIKPFYYKFKKK